MATVMCWLVNMLYTIKSFKNIHKPFVCKTTRIQKNYIKVSKNYNLSTSTREFLQIFRKFFIKSSSFKSIYFGGGMRYMMRRRDTEQIVRTASINSNEVIRGLTRIRLKVTLIALLTNRPTPPPLRPDVRGE